jgi:hypothetical protein
VFSRGDAEGVFEPCAHGKDGLYGMGQAEGVFDGLVRC